MSICDTGVVHRARRQEEQAASGAAAHSTVTALRDYAGLRDAGFPTPSTPAFFLSARGRRMGREELNTTFTKLVRQVGLEGRGARAGHGPMTSGMPLPCTRCWTGTATGEDIDRRMPLLSTYLGHVDPASTYWYLEAVPELLQLVSERLEQLPGALVMSALAPALQAFFTDRLITQRNASPHTIAAYRDTFRLLLDFAHQQTGKQPFELDIDDLDAPLIGAFLTHLERDRGNSARTRNARLGAIHSFYRYAALEHPEHAHTIARVMAIPTKRHERSIVCYLDLTEIKRCSPRPIRSTWLGRRDHALLALMIQTGVRVSELVGLRIGDVHLGTGRHIRVLGKGRKKRATPLTGEIARPAAPMDHRTWRRTRGPAVPNPAGPAAQPLHRRSNSSTSTPRPQPATARR